MGKNIEEKSLGTMMPADIVDRFVEQVNERGFRNKETLIAAARVWVSLPPELQVKLISAKDGDVFPVLEGGLRDYDVQQMLSGLSEQQKTVALNAVKQAVKAVSQKPTKK